jgi:hypothetical protein
LERRLVLTARITGENGRYIARIDQLGLEAAGESVREAQDGLIDSLRTWIEMQDTTGGLEKALAEAGFPGVEEDTELQLEFE